MTLSDRIVVEGERLHQHSSPLPRGGRHEHQGHLLGNHLVQQADASRPWPPPGAAPSRDVTSARRCCDLRGSPASYRRTPRSGSKLGCCHADRELHGVREQFNIPLVAPLGLFATCAGVRPTRSRVHERVDLELEVIHRHHAVTWTDVAKTCSDSSTKCSCIFLKATMPRTQETSQNKIKKNSYKHLNYKKRYKNLTYL